MKTKAHKNKITKIIERAVNGFVYSDTKKKVVCEAFENNNIEELKTDLTNALRKSITESLTIGEDFLCQLAIRDELGLDMSSIDLAQLADPDYEGEDYRNY